MLRQILKIKKGIIKLAQSRIIYYFRAIRISSCPNVVSIYYLEFLTGSLLNFIKVKKKKNLLITIIIIKSRISFWARLFQILLDVIS